jgi:hypothetical protein
VLDVKPVRLIYYNLQDNSCVVASREEKQLKELHGTIQEVAFDIRAREFPARPGFICKYCEYRFLCPAQESRSVQIESGKLAEQEAVRSSLKQN